MKSRDLIKAAFACKETPRIPWVPFVGCHAGALIGKSAKDFLQSEELMFQGISKAIEIYRPDGIPVIFDLQLEAEAMNCTLLWADENPPSVSGHAIPMGYPIESLKIPSADSGRIGIVLNSTRRLRKQYPDVALYGLITGPFTLALHLLGTDIFMKMYDEPEYVQKLMKLCGDVCKAMSGYFIAAGCDVVAVVDPMTSQIGPDAFREFVTPYAKDLFGHIKTTGAMSSFFVCGHAQQNIEAMCECGPDNISVDENIPLNFVKDICLPAGVSFGGNLQLTSVLLLGTAEDSQRNAVECMEIGGKKGYILAPGCDLPYSTPVENLKAVADVALDEYKFSVAKTMTVSEERKMDLLDMKEYGRADKVIVDIITLDSEACAPCQYMVEAVRAVAPEFEGIVEWREHKIKKKDSIVFMTSLMVRNIPTICIDGEIKFVSRIPARDELVMAIQRRVNEKMRLKIQSRKASVFVLGHGPEADAACKNMNKAIAELGADINVHHIKDNSKIAEYGFVPSQTPVTILARYQTKAIKSVPEVQIIKEWIKDII